MVHRPAAARKSRNLLEMQILRLHPRASESNVLRWVPATCVVTSSSGDSDVLCRLRNPKPGQYSHFSKEGTTIRTHGQSQGGGWKQGREVGLAGVGGRGGEKMQTTVNEQQ